MTVKPEIFNNHLDACQQCANHPFDLCADGLRLLYEAAGMPTQFHAVRETHANEETIKKVIRYIFQKQRQ